MSRRALRAFCFRVAHAPRTFWPNRSFMATFRAARRPRQKHLQRSPKNFANPPFLLLSHHFTNQFPMGRTTFAGASREWPGYRAPEKFADPIFHGCLSGSSERAVHIGLNGIVWWSDGQINQPRRTPCMSFLEPLEEGAPFAQAEINDRKNERCNVTPFRLFLEFGRKARRFRSLSCQRASARGSPPVPAAALRSRAAASLYLCFGTQRGAHPRLGSGSGALCQCSSAASKSRIL